MAIDEALLQNARTPILRFYRWSEPSVSFGYFGKVAEAREFAGDRALVRRWTGGGIVPHGDDLTYSIIIPKSDPVFAESSMLIYERVHGALRDVFNGVGTRVDLMTNSTVIDRRCPICFANPVAADVIEDGRKIAGAAQRKTRKGLLHQGSIQREDLGEEFRAALGQALSGNVLQEGGEKTAPLEVERLAARKYATPEWLHRR